MQIGKYLNKSSACMICTILCSLLIQFVIGLLAILCCLNVSENWRIFLLY